MRRSLLLAVVALGGCGLFEPEEKTLPPAYVRVCLSDTDNPFLNEPGDCRGDGHWQSERVPVRQPDITVPLRGVPIRLCRFTLASVCRESPEDHYLLRTTDTQGYAVFRPARDEPPEVSLRYIATLDVDSFEYRGCTLVIDTVSKYGDVVSLGPRIWSTPPEYHNEHIAELWMVKADPWCELS